MKIDIVAGTSMKITCSRDELVSKLGIVSRAVSTRGAVQVLSGVLLRAEGGRLELAATDMEISLRATLPAELEGEGAVVVPGKLFSDLARLLPQAEGVSEDRPGGGVVQIASGSYSSRLKTH